MKINLKGVLSVIFVFSFMSSIYIFLSFDNETSKVVVSNVDDVIAIDKIRDKLSINEIERLRDYYDNQDIKAVISIDGIDGFNYPVVQTSNNDYYLNHNYYKEYDPYGAIYADYRFDLDNSKKILIFGHSSIKRDTPFNSLENYYNESYFKEHKYITLETKTNSYKYEIFSVYVEISDFTYMNMNFNSKEDWYSHILGLKDKSLYETGIELNIEDDILIMQTCSTNSNYKDYKNKYLLIVSRRVKE